jgi:hypothetical protein
MRALFFNPDLPKGISAFKSKLLANVRLLPRRLDREDFYGFERRGSMQQAGHYEQHESRRFQSYGSYNEAYNYQISRNQQSWQNQYNYSQSQDYSNQRHNPYYQQQQQNSYYSNQRHLPYYQQQKQNNNYPNQRKY